MVNITPSGCLWICRNNKLTAGEVCSPPHGGWGVGEAGTRLRWQQRCAFKCRPEDRCISQTFQPFSHKDINSSLVWLAQLLDQSEVRTSRGRGVGFKGTRCFLWCTGGRKWAAFTAPWWRPRGWTERCSRCSWWSGRTCWCGRWPSGTRASLWSCTPPVGLQDKDRHEDRRHTVKNVRTLITCQSTADFHREPAARRPAGWCGFCSLMLCFSAAPFVLLKLLKWALPVWVSH